MNLRHLALGCLVALAAPACAASPPALEQTGALEAADTATCIYASQDDPAQPFTLTPTDPSALDGAADAWGYGIDDPIYGITSYTTFSTPLCSNTTPSIQAVMDDLSNTDQDQPDPAEGVYTDRAGLTQSVLFQDAYGDGPALLAGIDAYAGGGDVQAWLWTQGMPCPNCHEYALRAVLFYPATGVVVSLVGYYGYGS